MGVTLASNSYSSFSPQSRIFLLSLIVSGEHKEYCFHNFLLIVHTIIFLSTWVGKVDKNLAFIGLCSWIIQVNAYTCHAPLFFWFHLDLIIFIYNSPCALNLQARRLSEQAIFPGRLHNRSFDRLWGQAPSSSFLDFNLKANGMQWAWLSWI